MGPETGYRGKEAMEEEAWGSPFKKASVLMPSLVNGTLGAVPQLLGKSSLLCY